MNQYDFHAHKPSANYHKSDIWLLISILLLWGFGLFTIFVCFLFFDNKKHENI